MFSFDALKGLKEKGRPEVTISLRDVVKAEAIDPQTVRYTFKGEFDTRSAARRRRAAHPVEGVITPSTRFDLIVAREAARLRPLRDRRLPPGTFVTYKRRPDYWAKDLAVNRGRFNFDELRYEYYRDRTVELEGLKSANYRFPRGVHVDRLVDRLTTLPSVKEGRLVRLVLPDQRPSGAQGFFVNTRREPFKDKRVREALGLAFDFEWSNKNLFFESLQAHAELLRELGHEGARPCPAPEELALLEPFRDKLAPEVFGEPVSPPVTDASGTRPPVSEARARPADGGRLRRRRQAARCRDPLVRGRLRPHHHSVRRPT